MMRRLKKDRLWFLFMGVIMQLGAGLNTGCLSLLILGLIAMLSACLVRSFILFPLYFFLFIIIIIIIIILNLIGSEFY